MNYAEKRNTVWMIEVRQANPATIWNLTWQATGADWYFTRREALAALVPIQKTKAPTQEYRVRRYVRKERGQ